MDEQNRSRGPQPADRETSVLPGGVRSETRPSAVPSDRSVPDRGKALETVRLAIELRSPDGQLVSKAAAADPWRALHEFSGLASQDLGRRLGVGASAEVIDRDGTHGARLEVDDTGANQLKFDTDEGRALYKQVYRERQLALSQAPMSNRIEAMAPDAEQPARVESPSRTSEATISATQLRQSVLEQMANRSEPATADERQQRERDRQIVAKASGVQLGLIAEELPKDDGAQLRKVFDRVQRDIEASVGRDRTPPQPSHDRLEENAEENKRRAHGDPPIQERFTAIEHMWRTDYWQRDRPDRLGFTETWLTLKTAEHSAAVIMGMVDRARERGWTKLHLDGSPEFKREAWILATARGLETSGYTATLGDREAVKAEQRRLSQGSRDHSRGVPSRERDAQLGSSAARQAVRPGEQMLGSARDSHLNAAITKAMQDARVPPGLQTRLREMITAEAQRRQTTTPQWRAQVYDSAAPRSRSAPELGPRTAQRDRQQER